MADRDTDPTLPAEVGSEAPTREDAEAVGFRVSNIPPSASDTSAPTLVGPPGARPDPDGGEVEGGSGRLGRYEVRGALGRGGVGEVLRGHDPELGRDVAIKRLRRELHGRPGVAERFLEEAQVTGQLQHPGVLPVFELDRDGAGHHFFAMKLVRGETLADLLDRRASPDEDRGRFVGIFEQICQTVGYAHAKGVIHRDLKPSNVMVGAFGEVQVLDWGLAKVLGASEPATRPSELDTLSPIATVRTADDSSQSIDGAVMGTPAYMPPEQARGEIDRLEARSDVFCLGGILLQILTGGAPYEGAAERALDRAAGAELGPARSRLDACAADDELVALAHQCLATRPEDRPRDGGAVARRVGEYRASLAARVHASELAAAEARATARQERRTRWWILGLSLAVLLAVGFGVMEWVVLQQQRQQARERQSRVVNGAMDRFAELLHRNHASPTTQGADWVELDGIAARLREGLPGIDDPEIRRRAEEVLGEFDRARSDRDMVRDLERLTAVGASYDDLESWQWMAEELASAFARHDLDPAVLGGDEVVRRIEESPIAEELAFGLGLWIRTETLLALHGLGERGMPELLERLELVLAADPDPLRVRLRKLTFAQAPSPEALLAEVEGPDFEALPPASMVLLVAAFSRVGYPDGWDRVCREGLLRFPDHYRLVESCAYAFRRQGRWDEAARLYTAVASLRPEIAGLWRSLGIALVRTGDTAGGVAALRRAVRLDPEAARNHLDLARALDANGQTGLALGVVDHALLLDDGLAPATSLRARLLASLGRESEAAAARAHCREQIASGDRIFEIVSPDPGSEDWRSVCLGSGLETERP